MNKVLLISLMFASLLAFSCTKQQPEIVEIIEQEEPTVILEESEPIWQGPPVAIESPDTFIKHLNPADQGLESWTELAPHIDQSLEYLSRKKAEDYAVKAKHLKIKNADLEETLLKLKDLLPKLDEDKSLFDKHFKWVQIEPHIKYSGYYEPSIKASYTKTDKYKYPLYSVPKDLSKYKRKKWKYHDRRAIDGKGVLKNKGLELVWLEDKVDAYYLHIQGSGRLIFEDGTHIYANYANQNGHKYRSAGRIMKNMGLLSLGDMHRQRDWLRRNPKSADKIFFQNPSYVFFRLGDKGAIGATGAVMRQWVSLATDKKVIPLGAVVAYGVNIPHEEQKEVALRAIGLAQDVGGAIKKNRIDVFCGADEFGEYVSGKLDKSGPAWVLVSKDYVEPIAKNDEKKDEKQANKEDLNKKDDKLAKNNSGTQKSSSS